jgi:RHS repeat-associated protein
VTKNNQRFIYDGYLQIANSELETLNSKLQTFIWAPTEPIATRPLVFYFPNTPPQYYTHDGNKNVSDLTDISQSISAHYTYTPFGALLSSSGSSATINPFRFSSEYVDDRLNLVYYNYRNYNPFCGKWISVDDILALNVYLFSSNNPIEYVDHLGLLTKKQLREILDKFLYCYDCDDPNNWSEAIRVVLERYVGVDKRSRLRMSLDKISDHIGQVTQFTDPYDQIVQLAKELGVYSSLEPEFLRIGSDAILKLKHALDKIHAQIAIIATLSKDKDDITTSDFAKYMKAVFSLSGQGVVGNAFHKFYIEPAIDAAMKGVENINESYDLQIYSIVVNSDNCRGIYNAIKHRRNGFFLKLRKALDKERSQ